MGGRRSGEQSSSNVTMAPPSASPSIVSYQGRGRDITVVCAAADSPRGHKRSAAAAATLAHRHLVQLQDAERVARWRASKVLRPSSGPPASERMQALRERIKLKAAAAKGWLEAGMGYE